MFHWDRLKVWLSRSASGGGRTRRTSGRRPLTVEALEDRTLPAVFNPLAAAADGSANSLRAAIIAANSNGQNDVFNLQAGTYQLAIANGAGGQENAAAKGDLDFTEADKVYTFRGAGLGKTFIDANDLDRVFHILGSNVTVIFRDLTITDGRAQDNGTAGAAPGSTVAEGGGIFNEGKLTLERVRILGNEALAGNGNGAFGGGIYSFFSSVLNVRYSRIVANKALGSDAVIAGDNGGQASGGGIHAVGASVNVLRSVVASNQAIGGNGGNGAFSSGGGNGGLALGGGINTQQSSLIVTDSTISSNQALGGNGGNGGAGLFTGGGSGGSGGTTAGGGIYGAVNNSLQLVRVTLANNLAAGGTGGTGGVGSAGGFIGDDGFSGGDGGSGGYTHGGGVSNEGTTTVQSCTFSGNQAIAGDAGNGGNGGNGDTPDGNGGNGGAGGFGSFGFGGGLRAGTDDLTVVNSTFSGNLAQGADGGDGGAGGLGQGAGSNGTGGDGGNTSGATGGGISSNTNTTNLFNSTVVFSTVIGGTAGTAGAGGVNGTPGDADAGGISADVTMISCLVALNSASLYPDFYGVIISVQNNLVGIGSPNLPAGNPDANGNWIGSTGAPVNPQIDPVLKDNGGPTLTHALLAGSLAINKGSNPQALTGDQRGYISRAIGGQADIGAFETGAISPHIFAAGVNGLAPAGVKQLKVFRANGTLKLQLDLYNRKAARGLRVAVGDLTGDGVPDIVAGPGSGVPARVFVINGATGAKVKSFLPYGTNYKSGVFVAVGDVDADAGLEIIVGPGAGKQKVKVFNALGQLQAAFFPFGAAYAGGIRMAAGNTDGVGLQEIVASRGGSLIQVRTFTGAGALRSKFNPAGVKGFPFVAAADVNSDGLAEIIVGDGSGRRTRIFSRTGSLLRTLPTPFGAKYTGGVRVGTLDVDNDGIAEVLTAPGPKGGRIARLYSGLNGSLMKSFVCFPAGFSTGFFVAGSA